MHAYKTLLRRSLCGGMSRLPKMNSHLGTDLHSHITRGNWDVEAGLVEFFRENFVIYDGVDVHKSTPKEIIASQRIVGYSDEQSEYYRIKYGEEVFMFTKAFAQRGAPCPDCS